MSPFAFACFVGVLLVAAAWDLKTFRIPNLLPIALAAGAVLLAAPTTVGDALSRLASVLLLGGGALALYLRGGMGGGDVKLIAAAALWIPVPQLGLFAAALGIWGGVQALAVLAAVRAEQAFARDGRVRDRPARMAYGASIAAAGLTWALWPAA